jgi:ABC-type Mn2+/Zn2+ transport system ATPase subunit
MQKLKPIKFGPYNLDLLPSLKISDLNLELKSKITHFWGENGVGKSTVMNLIIDELLIRKINFSFVNQNYRQNWLWWYGIAKNLSLAAGLKNEKDIYDLPEVKDQWSWLEKLLMGKTKPTNFAKVDELASINLSGGQLQRLILFREILRKPKFLLLDEVFSALDKAVVKELIEWLLGEQQKLGFRIIAISHDSEILEMLPGEVLDFSKDDQAILSLKSRI